MTLFELWFSQGICPVVGLLGHMVVLYKCIYVESEKIGIDDLIYKAEIETQT